MQTKTGVSVLIFNKLGQVLVGKRKGSHGEGMLSVPGGHIEFFENANITCDRELLEEIGVNFPNQYVPIGFSEDFFEEPVKKHYITLYYAVYGVDSDKIEIQNLEPEKCESWNWVDLKDLPNNMFCDTYKKIWYAQI
jgi:8-oxo-dGTP diphosphatase